MARVPFSRVPLDPRRTTNFLDSCAFDPELESEYEAAQRIRQLGDRGEVHLVLAHSNQKEIEHPNTPAAVKAEATKLLFSSRTELTADEHRRRADIHAVLTGNGNPAKYEADAAHVFEAGKYNGYFITTDGRILDRRQELLRFSGGAGILKPSEWLALYERKAGAD